jgi:hypothetical protein
MRQVFLFIKDINSKNNFPGTHGLGTIKIVTECFQLKKKGTANLPVHRMPCIGRQDLHKASLRELLILFLCAKNLV